MVATNRTLLVLFLASILMTAIAHRRNVGKKHKNPKQVSVEEAKRILATFNPKYTVLMNKNEIAAFDHLVDLDNKDKSNTLHKCQRLLQHFLSKSGKLLKNRDITHLPHILKIQLEKIQPNEKKRLSKMEIKMAGALYNRLDELEAKVYDIYDHAKLCLKPDNCSAVEGGFVDKIMQHSRNYTELTWAWKGVRDMVGPEMRQYYAEMIKNKRAIGLIYGYDPTERMIEQEIHKGDGNFDQVAMELWAGIEPLYKNIHAFVRHKLLKIYPGKFEKDGLLPANIFGNMYAQQWIEIAELVYPFPEADVPDITGALIKQKYTVHKIFKTINDFFLSLGMMGVTDKFWKNSMLEKPTDGRNVECHGSAFDMFDPDKDDFRIKICGNVDQDSFNGDSHEMGHIQYDMQFASQPPLLRNGANTAFHETVADTSLLAGTSPKRLNHIGLLDDEILNSKEADLNALMRHSLWDVVLLPWTLLIDVYRWQLLNGTIPLDQMNEKWWSIRERFQGMKPPVERSEKDFDAGSKHHIAANVGYFRYFIDNVVKFDFLKSLCKIADPDEQLHRCDISGSKEAGENWASMLKLGQSKPWREVKKVLTGTETITIDPLMEYYKPLYDFLKDYNKKHDLYVGWR